MRRTSSFDRDFRDLHGGSPPRPQIDIEIVQRRPLPMNRAAFCVALGSVALVWILILAAALLAMAIVGGVFIWALFNPA